jgi:hypothetical protein
MAAADAHGGQRLMAAVRLFLFSYERRGCGLFAKCMSTVYFVMEGSDSFCAFMHWQH